MKRLLPAILAIVCTLPAVMAQRLSYVGDGYAGTSVNTAVFRCSSLATHGEWQYISYYDADGCVVVGRRRGDSGRWTLHRTQYRGNVSDAHNVISLAVDGSGRLHLAFDHHGDSLRYCRGIAPDTLALGAPEPMVGRDEQDVTYPEFYLLDGGDLLFAYRSGASGRGNLVLNRYDLRSGRWRRVQDVLIDGEQSRSAYWQLCTDEKGAIHLSWVWRETWMVETNHDICYARSPDGGETWYKSTGERYELPIRLDNAEYACRIPQNSELINQTGMSADADGNPYIATYWRSGESGVPQYRLVWHDGRRWRQRQVSERRTPFTLRGGGTKMIPTARPRIAVDGRRAYYIFRDEERGSRVSIYRTRNLRSGRWRAEDLTDFAVGAWEPTFDAELWKRDRRLQIFVQRTSQGDGERVVATPPQPVWVLDAEL